MEVTLIGIAALAVGGFGFVTSDRAMLLAVGAFMPLEVAAAINLPAAGNLSVLCAQLLLILALARAVLVSYTRHGRFVAPKMPVSGLILAALVFYAFVSSYFFPRLMTGITEVFTLSRGVAITRLVPLAPSSGNITQPAYLMASALLFLLVYDAVRANLRLGFSLIAVIAGVTAAFALLDMVSLYLPLSAVWDQIRTANYAIMPTQTIAGIKRVIGGNPEPSSFSTNAVCLFGFYASLFLSGNQQRHLLAAAGFLVLTLLALASTGFVALAAVGVALAAGSGLRFVKLGIGRRVLTVALIATPFAAAAALILVNTPAATDLIDRVLQQLIFGKLETSSGEERLTWTRQGFQNFMDTYGLGVGLGSNRSNGLVAVVLSQIGAPGAILFAAFLATSFMRSLTRTSAQTLDPAAGLFRAARTAAFAVLVAGMASGTRVDLGPIWFTMVGVAVAAHEIAAERRRAALAARPRGARDGPGLAAPPDPAVPSSEGGAA